MSEFEQRLRELVHEIAGIPQEQVNMDATAAQLNIDPLDLTDIILTFEDEFGVPVGEGSYAGSMSELAAAIEEFAGR